MRTLLSVVSVVALQVGVSGCLEPDCTGVDMGFIFVNETTSPARMLSGYESQQAQVGSQSCGDTSLFIVPAGGERTYVHPETVCPGDGSLRTVGVIAGVASPCKSYTMAIGSKDRLFERDIQVIAVLRETPSGEELSVTFDRHPDD